MSAIETASPRASWSASETAPRISEDSHQLRIDFACEFSTISSLTTIAYTNEKAPPALEQGGPRNPKSGPHVQMWASVPNGNGFAGSEKELCR